MTRREQITHTLKRLAEVKEQMALVDKVRADRRVEEAESEVEAVARQQREGDATLDDGLGTLTGAERQLLWSHRSQTHVQRERAERVLVRTRDHAEQAHEAHLEKAQQRQVSERIHAHVTQQARAEAERREQREQDDMAAARWSAKR